MSRLTEFAVVVFFAVVLLADCGSAAGAFVDGVERFDGTVKDTQTWQEHLTYYGVTPSIAQDNLLTIDARPQLPVPPNCGYAEYVTRTKLATVGAPVSVEVLLSECTEDNQFNNFLALSATFNPQSPDLQYDLPCIVIHSMVSHSDPSKTELLAEVFSESGGCGRAISLSANAYEWYVYRIERPTSDTAICTVLELGGSEVGSVTWDLAGLGFPDALYIRLGAYNTSTSFDNARIPEPAALSLLALGACLPLLRRRS